MSLSNNVLTTLLVFSIIVSIFGTWTVLSYMDSDLLTGKATDTATTTLTVTGIASCTATDNTISFGTMERSTSNDSVIVGDYITVENDGNSQINISVYATGELWDDVTYQAPSSYWQIKCNNSESGTCNTTYANIPAVDGNLVSIDLDSADSTDLLTVAVNVTVPSDEVSGSKSGTLTFSCIAD
ncbi:hypothetical protein HN865_03240 [Candidatus Woesearchaeota archaeon]|jgi:hypothetical protein|nr:hypothetical protein [Candidatus Woesearchaeota archaeon]MBT7237847.1 hypothetical protein [Candidatus Woesearchaeota archaeon]